ncbi:MAG: PqqD family protein [Caldilineaceae bacterium]|nr:PqqD family protein [Caldilinea sp.]MCB0055878.1 PqqD family protein [Caldilineaceae bacterium]HRW48194.1 PqqD family protein [Caldilinea sp.]
MSADNTVYKINSPRIIHETIDRDTVVIDTESGVYFNISGSGTLLFQMLESGADVAHLSKDLASRAGADLATVQQDVSAFVARLLAEELIVAAAEATSADARPEWREIGGEAYEPPVIQKFTDMAELLLVDPIHEVDERGWPHKA